MILLSAPFTGFLLSIVVANGRRNSRMFTIIVTLMLLAIIALVCCIPIVLGASKAGAAQVHKLGRRADEADPLALLNQAVDDGVASIQNAKTGLDNYRVLILSVQRQVENGEKEKARLEARIREVLQEGDPHRAAREYALMLADVEENIATNREQLARHKETYDNFAKQVEVGQSRVLAARQKATLLGLELEQSKREKEMARFARDFAFDPDGLNSDLARAEELIYQKIDANRAVGHVAEDLIKPILVESVDEDKERKAAAAKILERFGQEPPKQSQ
jgi:phage shock protein A